MCLHSGHITAWYSRHTSAIWDAFVPTSSLMKTPSLSTDDLAQEDLMQKDQERVERISQNRVIKFRLDAGFLTTVDVGQYFVTRDTEEFSPFYRYSGLSWVHFAKRWNIFWPERLDAREYQIWARIGSRSQLHIRQMSWNLNLST